MAYPTENHGIFSCNGVIVRVAVVLITMFLAWHVFGPQLLLWKENYSGQQVSCHCDCDCSDNLPPLLPLDFMNGSLADCGEHDSDISEEIQKDIVALLSEEIALQKRVANDTLEHTMNLVTDARQASLHYQREAEKCNAQMETCEQARERAEAQLVEERRVTAEWERRAREFGWIDSRKLDR